ncbi:Longin domain-containing protein [Citrus sinensis]|nr:Longin domain-containing protein [Citrus sinensis]
MVKMTIVGRVSDGLPLARGPRYLNQEHDSFSFYKQQAEFILKEISRGALAPSKMTIRVDHHSFQYPPPPLLRNYYLMENGIGCFITLCDSSYPRKLVFHYLQDLQKEFQKFDISLIDKITRPYSCVKFESIIGNIRKQYVDTRTQANLSKLNANRGQDLDIVIEHMYQIVERKRQSEISEEILTATRKHVSSIWGSPRLEVIALKWTPIAIIVAVAAILLWANLVLTDEFIV